MSRAIDAVQVLNDINSHRRPTPVSEFESGFNSGLNQAMWIIRHAPTLAPPNAPLTIEQLREMDGEPVYAPETNCWVLITKNQFVPLFTWPDGEQCSAHDWYEQVGPVYRRPPEGEA